MMRFSLFIVGFLFCMVCINMVRAGSTEQIEVSVRIMEKVEEGDIVEIKAGELNGEEAEVISVDKEKKEVIVRLLFSEELSEIRMNLSDVKLLRDERRGLMALKFNNTEILAVVFIVGIVFLIVILTGKKKKKKRKIKRKRRKKEKKREARKK